MNHEARIRTWDWERGGQISESYANSTRRTSSAVCAETIKQILQRHLDSIPAKPEELAVFHRPVAKFSSISTTTSMDYDDCESWDSPHTCAPTSYSGPNPLLMLSGPIIPLHNELTAMTKPDSTLEKSNQEGSNSEISSQPLSSLQSGQEASRPKSRANQEADCDANEGPGQDVSVAERASTSSLRWLACPYFKHDSREFLCGDCHLPTIASLKEHLRAVHKQPEHYCYRCYQRFESKDQTQNHLDNALHCSASSHSKRRFQEMMTEEKAALIELEKTKKNVETEWNKIFLILFPQAQLPRSPYADVAIHGPLDDVYQYLQTHAAPLIAHQLRSAGLSSSENLIELTEQAINRVIEKAGLHRREQASGNEISNLKLLPPIASANSPIPLAAANPLSLAVTRAIAMRLVHAWALYEMCCRIVPISPCSVGGGSNSSTVQQRVASTATSAATLWSYADPNSLCKRQRTGSDDGEEPEDPRDKRPCRQPEAEPEDRVSERIKFLKCPYFANDPERYSNQNQDEINYRSCQSCTLKDIPKLKQHLERTHLVPPNLCPRCYKVFQSAFELSQHLRHDVRCQASPPRYTERMTWEQLDRIKRAKRYKDSIKEKFNYIYSILFPNQPFPESPYIESREEDFMRFYRRLPDLLTRELVLEGLVQGTPEQAHATRAVIENALEMVRDRPEPTPLGLRFAGMVQSAVRPRPNDVQLYTTTTGEKSENNDGQTTSTSASEDLMDDEVSEDLSVLAHENAATVAGAPNQASLPWPMSYPIERPSSSQQVMVQPPLPYYPPSGCSFVSQNFMLQHSDSLMLPAPRHTNISRGSHGYAQQISLQPMPQSRTQVPGPIAFANQGNEMHYTESFDVIGGWEEEDETHEQSLLGLTEEDFPDDLQRYMNHRNP